MTKRYDTAIAPTTTAAPNARSGNSGTLGEYPRLDGVVVILDVAILDEGGCVV